MSKYEGAGGYGTTSTLNQDMRQGKFYPHINIFILEKHPKRSIKCFTCNSSWIEGNIVPRTCKKDQWVSAEEILK